MGFPRQEYQNGLPFHSPGDLDNLEIEPMSPTLATEPPGKPREDLVILKKHSGTSLGGPTAGGEGLIPGQRSRIRHALQQDQNQKFLLLPLQY